MYDIDLDGLMAFVEVAKRRSFRHAAALCNVSPSTMSAGIRRLEDRLGVRLLNRTTRSVTLTEAGARFLEAINPALGEFRRAFDAIDRYRESPRGTLRLNVPTMVAELILPSIVTRFLSVYPDIDVEVRAEDSFVDVLAEGFDAGVRFDERLEQDMIAVPIGPRTDRFVLAASPAYLEAHGTPAHPSELRHHKTIRHRFANGRMPDWEFVKGEETVRISPPARLIVGRWPLAVAAGEAGHGFVHSFGAYLQPAIERGTLVEVLEEWSEQFSGPFLYFADQRLMPAPLRLFVDFIRADQRQPK